MPVMLNLCLNPLFYNFLRTIWDDQLARKSPYVKVFHPKPGTEIALVSHGWIIEKREPWEVGIGAAQFEE